MIFYFNFFILIKINQKLPIILKILKIKTFIQIQIKILFIKNVKNSLKFII